METETALTNIEAITGQIIAHKDNIGRNLLEIGRLLIAAKAQLSHGEWLPWLRDRVDFSQRTAQQLMQVSRGYASNPQLAADLGSIRKAVALLAVPEEEREAFAADHNAPEISARELEQAIREREAAEESRLEMERSLQTANELLSAARSEIDELKSRPVEVAVQTVVDEKAVKAAAKEAKRKAEEAAAQKIEALTLALEEAKANSGADRAAQADVARLKKELEIARNEDVLGVQIAFEQTKDAANRMQGHILRMEAKGQSEAAGKCRRAVAALAAKLAELGRN
jgi:hypothetical protein